MVEIKKPKHSLEEPKTENPPPLQQPASIKDDEGFARRAGEIIARAVGPSEDVPPRSKRK